MVEGSRHRSISNRLQLRVIHRTTILSHDDRIRIAAHPARRRSGRRSRPAARPRPALDAPAPDADRGPLEDRWPRDGVRARRALPGDRPRDDPLDRLSDARRPRGARPARATATAPTVARSSTSCRPPSTATSIASTAGRPGRSRPTRPRRSSPRSTCGVTSRSTSAISRSPAGAAPVARRSMGDGGDRSAAGCQSPDGTPMMLKPPSTYSTSPVTALERSDAR